jgi:hypothetical protein
MIVAMAATDTTPRLRWKAVVVGAIVDQGGSMAMAIIVAIVTEVLNAAKTHGTIVRRDPSTYESGQLIYELLSVAFVVLGGLVAARMAKTLMVLHGLAVGVASLIGAYILGALMGMDFGTPGRALFFGVLTLVAGPLGGAIATLFGVPEPRPAMPAPADVSPTPAPAADTTPAPVSAPGLWVDLREARNQPPRY